MVTNTRILAAALLLALSLCSGSVVAAHAQERSRQDETVEALLREVRLLRETLQRLSLNAFRGQIVAERMRIQTERVARLSGLLDEVRGQIVNVQGTYQQFETRVKEVEAQLQQTVEPGERNMVEHMLKQLQSSAGTHQQQLDRLRERELRLAAELQNEQGKLSDLERRLDDIEREIEDELERQRAEDEERRRSRRL